MVRWAASRAAASSELVNELVAVFQVADGLPEDSLGVVAGAGRLDALPDGVPGRVNVAGVEAAGVLAT